LRRIQTLQNHFFWSIPHGFINNNTDHSTSFEYYPFSPLLTEIMPGRMNNGVMLYGHHDESTRDCNPNNHAKAKLDGNVMTGWQPLRHHMYNASATLCQLLAKQHTSAQRAALRRLETVVNQPTQLNTSHIREALDEIFFGKLLGDRVKVAIANLNGAEGETQFATLDLPRIPKVNVRVSNFNDSNYYQSRPLEKRLRIVSTLIHELCHAFLLIYGCDGRQCATFNAVANGSGFTGHGPSWEKIARKAEKVFTEHIVPMFDVEDDEDRPFGIENSLEEEDEYRSMYF
jgi:hypothetical protein